MSKKKKRQVRTIATNPAVSRTQTPVDTFNPDYSYVKRDLRRIGILAGSFVLILIALSFFL